MTMRPRLATGWSDSAMKKVPMAERWRVAQPER